MMMMMMMTDSWYAAPAAAAVDRYLLPARCSAANQPHAAAAVDRRDRQTARYAGFYAETCRSSEEASRGIANGGARKRRRRGEMHSDSAYRVAGLLD